MCYYVLLRVTMCYYVLLRQVVQIVVGMSTTASTTYCMRRFLRTRFLWRSESKVSSEDEDAGGSGSSCTD
ncbi:hypothetical protein AMECASPLE_033461 [Ameca splendens]|uniref:Secreted protein n=1 Tax=Ameca splendens TaxID=208324 RepID=A0ABV0Y6R9_9TELE